MCYFSFCQEQAFYKICWYDNVITVCKKDKERDGVGCSKPCKKRWWQRG